MHYVEADGAPAFAAALVTVLRAPAPAPTRSPTAGRALAQTDYSVAALARRIAAS